MAATFGDKSDDRDQECRNSMLTTSTSCSFLSCDVPEIVSAENEYCQNLQRLLFHREQIRVSKQAPLPGWMHVFMPRFICLQSGKHPYVEYSRSSNGQARKRHRLTPSSRVERVGRKKLVLYLADSNSTHAWKSFGDVVDPSVLEQTTFVDRWVLKFDNRKDRDAWARALQDAMELSVWMSKFSLGRLLMSSSSSAITECFTWSDHLKPSFVMKTIDLRTKRRVESARNEITIHQMLSNVAPHPNILGFHDSFRQSHKAYLVLEYCAGGDLFDYIRSNGPIPESRTKAIFQLVLATVAFLHDHGVVHLDLKPENICFKISPQHITSLKIADFGSACNLKCNHRSNQSVSCTLGYAAPEVLENGQISYAADMFSLGALLFVMLVGYPPFVGSSDEETRIRTLQCSLDSDETSWSGFGADARDLVSRLLVRNPSDRINAVEALGHPWFQSS